MSAPPPYLRLQGIEKRFGAFQALKGVDLEVRQGEFVCFLGPSGCGKTTLLRVIAGLEVHSAGRIEQSGRDISRLPPAQRDYGIVFQSYALFPNLTVADNVAYGLVNRRVPRAQVRERVAELLQTVGLPGTESKFPSQLSGGQQQRIALARALATAPGLLLLDEPLSALDAIVRVHLRQEIRALQRRLGVTTIMVTHDQEEALSVADRIVVMNHGVIEQVGTPEVVYREPATPFVADFVGRINMMPAMLEAPGRLRIGSVVLGIHPRAGDGLATSGRVTAYLRPEDIVPCESASQPVHEHGHGSGAAGSFDAVVEKIEFLGAYGLAKVNAPALGGLALTALVSRHGTPSGAWAEGASLRLRLRPEAVRLFAS